MRAKLESKLFESLPDIRLGNDFDATNLTPLGVHAQHSTQIITEPLVAPKGTVPVETHIDLIKRVQKLELITNRLIADSGKIGEGYKSAEPTAAEKALSLK